MTIAGDAEAAAGTIIREDADVQALAAVVSNSMVGYARGDRWIRVRRTGGLGALWMLRDAPDIEVATHAEDYGTATDLAKFARAALFAAKGRDFTPGELFVCDVADRKGLALEPNPDDEAVPRYTFTVALITKAYP